MSSDSFAGSSGRRLLSLAADARLLAAHARQYFGRLDEAERSYRALLSMPAQKVRALRGLGRMLSRSRRYDEAIEVWKQAVEADPVARVPLVNLAASCQRTGRVDEALQCWSRLAELSPDDIDARLQIARLRHKHRRQDEEAAIRDVLALEPQHREGLILLARFLGRNRVTVPMALDLWIRVHQSRPSQLWPLLERAKLLIRNDRFGDAEDQFRAILAIAPRDASTHIALGRLYYNRGRTEEALQVFEALLGHDGSNVDALLWRGQVLDRLDRVTEAEATYNRALAIDPRNTAAYAYRARMRHAVGRTEEAVEDWKRACALDPQQGSSWRSLIYLLAATEQESQALATLDRAEAALGSSPAANIDLGLAAEAAMFNDRAVAFFGRAVAAEPDNAAHLTAFGQYYYRQGEIDSAYHTLLDSRERDPYQLDVAKDLVEIVHGLNALGIDHVALRRSPRTDGEILFPERLFDRVQRIADTTVVPYEPVSRRVIVVNSSLAPGGAERQLVNMLRGLAEPSHDLDLALFCISLSSRGKRDFFRPLLDGVNVEIAVPDPRALETYLRDPAVAPYAELIRRFPEDMIAPISFWLKEFRARRPAIVHAWQDQTNLSAAVAALLAGVPKIILCTRSVRPDNPRRRLKRYMKDAYQAVLGHRSVMLTNNSRAGAEDYAAWLGLDPRHVAVVHNGMDFERLEQGVDRDAAKRERAALGIPDHAPVLGSVFRMSEEKRPLLWLDVAAEVARARPETHFIVCGDGPMRNEMIERAALLGISDRVHLPGSRPNIGTWYSMMDVVMLTSRHEGLPNVLLEAQGLGIPVVAPDVGGMSETVWQGVTGWTVRDADAKSLAERVLFCLGDAAWRESARAKARHFVHDGFGMAAMVRRNLEIYGLAP